MVEKKYRILVAEDEAINRKILSELLEDEYEIILAKNGVQVFDRLNKDFSIDLIILDILMPEMDGYEVLRKLKSNEKTNNIPVIIISALDSDNDEELGLKLGASDYITKPFHHGVVKLRVMNHIKIIKQREMLETQLGYDCLTEINNRRFFDEMFEKEIKRAERNHLPLSLIMIDVDYFKNFNDCYGHAEGDIVLREVALSIKSSIRVGGDVVARYGGEEFVVLLPETDKEGAKIVGEKIRDTVTKLNIKHEKSEICNFVTISLGGATVVDSSDSLDKLVEMADEMLYKAKKSGRNKLVWK